ncbi:threonine/serine dehydratase [Nocardiopsis sp. CNT-189]|uniref:threonine ammonia-lyase n=1 Tax=Nocardiopsis oceanisediminis TaxID=2816862 RepID=UPI003B393D69
MELISLADVQAAAGRIRRRAVRTPLLSCPWAEGRLWLKPENLQPVGAFKIRGATNALRALPERRRAAGVVTHSSGNHGQALAYAARAEEVRCTVVVPEGAPEVKLAAMRRLGAELVPVAPADRERTAVRLAERRGMVLVPPFDDREVIAGQGTIGLEVVEDLAGVDAVLVPVGGGGLASGVATAVKGLRPDVAVVGVEPELAAEAAEGLAEGRRVSWSPERTHRTVADGVRVGPSDLTFAHMAARLDGIVTVTEEEITAAMGVIARRARVVAEPSGALAVAAHLAGRAGGGCAVAVVSGGNVDPELLARAVAAPPAEDGAGIE